MQRLLSKAVKAQFRQAMPAAVAATTSPNGPQRPTSGPSSRLRTRVVPDFLSYPKKHTLRRRKKRA
jgi:hypothetical protein